MLATFAPGLAAMGVLLFASAFFSSSEAALFSLDQGDRRRLASAGGSGRVALRLLEDSDRLLTAVLFWNLLVNLAYFALASMLSLRCETPAQAGALAVGALFAIILFSEMLP